MVERRERRFQAWAMIGLGAVIVGLCGLCTLNVARNGGAYGLEYIFGGLPILGGGFMIARGILDLVARGQGR